MNQLRMKKNDIFQIKTPNGVEIEAVIASILSKEYDDYFEGDKAHFVYIAYSQNRLFLVQSIEYTYYTQNENGEIVDTKVEETELQFVKTIVDYCIIPELDKLLENE